MRRNRITRKRKKEKKYAKCPYCNIKIKWVGEPGQKIIVKCPNCGKEGIVDFVKEKEEDVKKSNKKQKLRKKSLRKDKKIDIKRIPLRTTKDMLESEELNEIINHINDISNNKIPTKTDENKKIIVTPEIHDSQQGIKDIKEKTNELAKKHDFFKKKEGDSKKLSEKNNSETKDSLSKELNKNIKKSKIYLDINKTRLQMPEKTTLNRIIWMIFLFFITVTLLSLFFVTVEGNLDIEILFISIFIGIVILKEVSDGFTPDHLKKKMNILISGLLVIFLLIVVNKIIYLIST